MYLCTWRASQKLTGQTKHRITGINVVGLGLGVLYICSFLKDGMKYIIFSTCTLCEMELRGAYILKRKMTAPTRCHSWDIYFKVIQKFPCDLMGNNYRSPIQREMVPKKPLFTYIQCLQILQKKQNFFSRFCYQQEAILWILDLGFFS